MLSGRVEASVRNDWLAVPAARNLATKWKALCGDDAACRHPVDTEKPGTVLAAELSEACGKLYHKFDEGYYWDGKKKRKINRDPTKRPCAMDMSQEEHRLAKDLTFLSSTCAGTSQIRIMIGHSLFGARVYFDEPLFLTISPSSRHNALTIRCPRYRASDPAMKHCTPQTKTLETWCGQYVPQCGKTVRVNMWLLMSLIIASAESLRPEIQRLWLPISNSLCSTSWLGFVV